MRKSPTQGRYPVGKEYLVDPNNVIPEPTEEEYKREAIRFLGRHGGYDNLEKVEDFVAELPYHAINMARRIQKALLEDRTISDEFKDEVASYRL